MRLVPLLCCLGSCVALAGCLGAGASNDIAPAAASAPPAAAAAADDGLQARAHSPPAHASTAEPRGKRGRAAAASKPDDEAKKEWWKDGPVTRDKVAAMCWMKFEKGRKDLPLEKRADLVNDCVDETLKEHPAP
jgi:hypothetical protein